MNKLNLKNIGLTETLLQESAKYTGFFIGRVCTQSKNLYKVITENGEVTAEISGKFRHTVRELSQYPAVGDFVMIDKQDSSQGNAIIHHVLPRKSVFARKVAGSTNDSQVVAANIDKIFICMSLNNDFNLRRLERYLAIAWDSGAIPVIVLTKSDLCRDIEAKLAEIALIAIGVEVLVTTSVSNDGYESVKDHIASGETAAFIGSSGVGKSTLINHLLGLDILETNEIRNDDKGKHTTTRRELIVLPNSGVVIDTPGMRELGIIHADLSKSFSDIDDLASKCRFSDCTHQSEPQCAVREAIHGGILSAERLESYRKLQKEMKYESLNSRMIEKEKIDEMFSSMGGMKNARKYLKEQNKRKRR